MANHPILQHLWADILRLLLSERARTWEQAHAWPKRLVGRERVRLYLTIPEP